MNKEYYKQYFDFEREHWWFRARNDIIKQLAKKYNSKSSSGEPLKILNVGVATGGTSLMLNELGTVTSIEYDKDCCDFLKEKLGIDAINASVLELPFEDNSFDLVCAFDVIEHVEDDQKAVEEMSRVAKNDGIVMITVPAFMFLWSHHDVVNHHFRRYKMNNLLQLFSSTDLKVLFKSYFNFLLFFPIASYRILFRKISKNQKVQGSDFEIKNGSGFLNAVLFRIFNSEKYLLKNKISLPTGVSIFVVLKKLVDR